jgi:CheY-like chemotaxis protein
MEITTTETKPTETNATSTKTTGDVTQWNVLLVDDDLDQRIVISQVLDFYDAKVTVADCGQEALHLLENDPSFNLGLFDIRMPGMSGWQLLEEVRKHTQPTVRDMPIIAITANVMQGDRARVLSAGFKGYIPKPIEPITLVEDIRSILELDVKDSATSDSTIRDSTVEEGSATEVSATDNSVDHSANDLGVTAREDKIKTAEIVKETGLKL